MRREKSSLSALVKHLSIFHIHISTSKEYLQFRFFIKGEKNEMNETKKEILGLEADNIMSSSSINDPLLSCNCYPAKNVVPL